MIYDGNSTQIPIIIGETFLTEIGEGEEFKIIIIGGDSVGKTSILSRFTEGKFSTNYLATVGLDFLENEI